MDIFIVPDARPVGDNGSREMSELSMPPTNTVELRVAIRILNEDRLRQIATTRMSVSGFDTDPATHFDEPLGDLLFEALIGSNPDPMSPVDMGIEIVSWTGHPVS